MKIFQPPSYDRFCLFDVEKKNTDCKSMKDVQNYSGNEPAYSVTISEEGMNALREKLKEIKPEVEEPEVYELTVEDTNEVALEHYAAMGEFSSLTLKDGNYNLEDVMKSMMDAYETLYHKIVKEHENGDRQVSYKLTGESSLTLEQDLAGLDMAYNMKLANLEGYITCQQTNDGFKFFHSTDMEKEATEQKEYRDTAVSMMKQARKEFLAVFYKPYYKQGAAVGIIQNIMRNNVDFVEKTQKLFAHTIPYKG